MSRFSLIGSTAMALPAGIAAALVATVLPAKAATETILHAFTNADGCHPVAGLVFDKAGSLYGTTESPFGIALSTSEPA